MTVATKYDRHWYNANLDNYVRIAEEILAGGWSEPDAEGNSTPQPLDDRQLANELHEWLNAPCAFMQTWQGNDSDAQLAAAILDLSPNARIGGPIKAEGGEINYEFYAAHAFVADVMIRLKRNPGPYHG